MYIIDAATLICILKKDIVWKKLCIVVKFVISAVLEKLILSQIYELIHSVCPVSVDNITNCKVCFLSKYTWSYCREQKSVDILGLSAKLGALYKENIIIAVWKLCVFVKDNSTSAHIITVESKACNNFYSKVGSF